MGTYNFGKIFSPKNIAVVGASEQKGSIGNAIMKNLMKGGFPGELIPVNPKYFSVHGLPCSSSITKVNQAIDLAIIATPIKTVPAVVEECVQVGIGGGHCNLRGR